MLPPRMRLGAAVGLGALLITATSSGATPRLFDLACTPSPVNSRAGLPARLSVDLDRQTYCLRFFKAENGTPACWPSEIKPITRTSEAELVLEEKHVDAPGGSVMISATKLERYTGQLVLSTSFTQGTVFSARDESDRYLCEEAPSTMPQPKF